MIVDVLFKGLGGLVRDTYEVIEDVVEEIVEAPGAFAEGLQEGFFTSEDPSSNNEVKEVKEVKEESK